MKIKKAVITAAGLGTRLLPSTKELPKEMLPIFTKGRNGQLLLKPLLQMLFEQLYRVGIREFCFVVGRGKRAIEDHFTPDWKFVEELNKRGKESMALELQAFYEMIEGSHIVWVNQPEPRGFGHAVLMAKPFVEDESFMVLAGDTYIISVNDDHLRRLLRAFSKSRAESTLLLQRIENPRMYGVAVVKEINTVIMHVVKVIEKPPAPPSNWAIMPHYVFKPCIMEALAEVRPGVGGEIQLTDAIQRLIENGNDVIAVALKDSEVRLDIGTPITYWEALLSSYKRLGSGGTK